MKVQLNWPCQGLELRIRMKDAKLHFNIFAVLNCTRSKTLECGGQFRQKRIFPI